MRRHGDNTRDGPFGDLPNRGNGRFAETEREIVKQATGITAVIRGSEGRERQLYLSCGRDATQANFDAAKQMSIALLMRSQAEAEAETLAQTQNRSGGSGGGASSSGHRPDPNPGPYTGPRDPDEAQGATSWPSNWLLPGQDANSQPDHGPPGEQMAIREQAVGR